MKGKVANSKPGNCQWGKMPHAQKAGHHKGGGQGAKVAKKESYK